MHSTIKHIASCSFGKDSLAAIITHTGFATPFICQYHRQILHELGCDYLTDEVGALGGIVKGNFWDFGKFKKESAAQGATITPNGISQNS